MVGECRSASHGKRQRRLPVRKVPQVTERSRIAILFENRHARHE
jgi:hypothetical protein